MATRGFYQIEGKEFLVTCYRHWDNYPLGFVDMILDLFGSFDNMWSNPQRSLAILLDKEKSNLELSNDYCGAEYKYDIDFTERKVMGWKISLDDHESVIFIKEEAVKNCLNMINACRTLMDECGEDMIYPGTNTTCKEFIKSLEEHARMIRELDI